MAMHETHYLDLDKVSVNYEVVPLLDNMEDFPDTDVLLSSFTFLEHRTRKQSTRTLKPCFSSNFAYNKYKQK